MAENGDIERISTPYARALMIGFAAVTIKFLLIYYTPFFSALRNPLAYVLPLAMLAGIALVVPLYLIGRNPIPIMPLFGGLIFSIGGVVLDAGATIINTPTLARESNVIARALLDSGHPIGFVYAYGIASQTLYLILVCVLWITFLRHRLTLLASAKRAHPKSRLDFIKAVTGGAHLSWRQYLLPLKLSELPKSYHLVMLVAVTLTGSMLFNWYLGLSWMGVLPVSHTLALIICILLSVLCYAGWNPDLCLGDGHHHCRTHVTGSHLWGYEYHVHDHCSKN